MVLKDLLIVISLVGLFVILKTYGLNLAVSDENIYFYDSWLMSQGFWPYRDFFFAHPPLHLLPGWLLTLVGGGFHFNALKMLPVMAAIGTGLCVYSIAKRAGGAVAAATAGAMFFLSHEPLRASNHWTGVNWSVAWMSAGLLMALQGRAVVSGILLALGMCTGVYVAPGAFLIVVLITCVNRKNGMRCARSALISWLMINGAFFLIGGQGYIDGVYRYHYVLGALHRSRQNAATRSLEQECSNFSCYLT